MKKIILIAVFSCLVSIVQAQLVSYVGLGIGYGGYGRIGDRHVSHDGTSDYNEDRMGKGLLTSISVGHMFNEKASFELEVGYLYGNGTNRWDAVGASHFLRSSSKYNIQSLYLNPSFVVLMSNHKVRPFIKVGAFVGLVNKGTYDRNTDASFSVMIETNEQVSHIRYSAGIAIGATGAFGLEYRLSDRIALSGNLFFRYANWIAPHTEEELTIYKTSTTTTTYNESHKDLLKMTAVGVNVGVKYYLKK